MQDAITQFSAAIRAAGLKPPKQIKPDGELHRFASNGKAGDDSGYYVLHLDGVPAGMFGDWRTGLKQAWRADIGRALTSEEDAAHRAKIEAMQQQRKAEKQRLHIEAAKQALKIWDAAEPAPDDHPYILRKGIKAHGVKLYKRSLVIPMYDASGALCSLQFIDVDGSKRFLKDGKVKGCYYLLGAIDGAAPLYIVEGFATGATIHEASGLAVAVTFNAGNLEPVAQAMRAKFPALPLIVCADDDYWQECAECKQQTTVLTPYCIHCGKAHRKNNTGLTKAEAAALAVGGNLIKPEFGTERDEQDTDFNDMARRYGLDAVRQHLASRSAFFLGQNFEDPSPESLLSSGVENFPPDEKFPNDVTNVTNVTNLDDAKTVIENVLAVCRNQPGELFSEAFINAVKVIRADPALWAAYRVKIKQAKPSGILLSDIDDATAPAYDCDNPGGDSIAAELVELVVNRGELFFDAQADKSFASVTVGELVHTFAIGSKPFTEWLSYSYYQKTKLESFGKSASEAAIKQACFALAGIAKHEGEQRRVYLRTADYHGGHYLFIGDERLRVIEVLPTGWCIIDSAPVKFWKPSSMQALPIPEPGGDLAQLWQFANIPEAERPLVLAWLLESLRTETPKPVLALNGTQGCAKSSTQNKLRQLIDNNAVNLRAAPKTVEDVFVSAGCNWLASFENISHLTPNMQDALCTLATGGGFAARTLYTNSDETIIEVKRPVIINSIPNVITAQDLTDRVINVELPRIVYGEEAKLNAQWEKAKPSIFGGLLDLFVKTLAHLPKVELDNPPRMADFTRLGEAMMQAQGHKAGVFAALYNANRAESIGHALQSSPVAVAVCEMVDKHAGMSKTVFYGTMSTLFTTLADYRRDGDGWPKSERGLGDILRRQSPALATLGIDITTGRKTEYINGKRGIPVTISKHGNVGNIGNVVSKLLPPAQNFHPYSAANIADDAEVF